MHSVVKERLEEYLGGELAPSVLHQIEAHLKVCEDCREEVKSMQEMRQLFSSLRAEEEVSPSAGFYVRVLEQAGARQQAPGFSGLFDLDFAFGRRLVFASLLLLAVLGSYLVSRETDYSSGPSAEAVMAQDTSSPTTTDRDHMLLTLTSYEP